MIEERRQGAMVRTGSNWARFEIQQNGDSAGTFWERLFDLGFVKL
jgi:hypothetical protein